MIDPSDPRRVVGLSGAPNFRDLGGYAVEGGGHVRTGRVYRSGKLTALTQGDRDRLHALGIDTVVDLRGKDERDGEPSEWPAPPREVFESAKASVRPALYQILSGVQDEAGVREGFIAFYAQLPSFYREEYQALFRRLARPDVGPMLVHCSAGKDRTGVACALLLWSLGVPRATIVDDYALTQALVPTPPERLGGGALPVGGAERAQVAYERLPAGSRRMLWAAHPDYLDAALAGVERDHGSVEGYLEQALELTVGEIASLRASLVA